MYLSPRSASAQPRTHFLYYDLEAGQTACVLARDSGAVLKLWLAVTHRAKLTGSDSVTVSGDLCRQFGILDRKARRRALDFWTSTGFWVVDPSPPPPGKTTGVRILSTPIRCRRQCLLSRCCVSALLGAPPASRVLLSCASMDVRVPWSTLRPRLINAHRTAAVFDAELIDHGSGWLLSELLPPSAVSLPPQVIEIFPSTLR